MLKKFLCSRAGYFFQPTLSRCGHTGRKEAFMSRQTDKTKTQRKSLSNYKTVEYDPNARNVYRNIADYEDDDGSYALEEIEDHIWETDRNFGAHLSEEDKRRQITKNRILKRKERAQLGPKEPNILTWAARAQIRFLHAQDPYQWAPEVLADSFPVSKEAIISILKSKRLPEDENEIEKHDRKVHRNWLKLKSELESKKDTDINLEGRTHIDNRLSKMINAAGIPSLPVPAADKIVMTKKRLVEKLHPKVVGPFSSIISDFKAQFEKENEKSVGVTEKPHKIAFSIGDEEAMKLLSSISEVGDRKEKLELKTDADDTREAQKMQQDIKPKLEQKDSFSESDKSKEVISSLRQTRRQRRLTLTEVSKDNLNDLQILGTGKIS